MNICKKKIFNKLLLLLLLLYILSEAVYRNINIDGYIKMLKHIFDHAKGSSSSNFKIHATIHRELIYYTVKDKAVLIDLSKIIIK